MDLQAEQTTFAVPLNGSKQQTFQSGGLVPMADKPDIGDLSPAFERSPRTSTVGLRLDPLLHGRNQPRLEVGLQFDLFGRLVGEPAHPSIAAGHVGPSQFEGYRRVGRSARDIRQRLLLLPPAQPRENPGAVGEHLAPDPVGMAALAGSPLGEMQGSAPVAALRRSGDLYCLLDELRIGAPASAPK